MAASNIHPALLIIIGEPTSELHAGLILRRVIDGLSTWSYKAEVPIDLNTELRNFLNKNVAPEHFESGSSVLRYNDPNLYVEIMVKPCVQSLRQSLLHFVTLPSTYKHIIHAGTAFAGNGSWILQDGTWSMQDFSRLLHELDATTALTQVAPGSALIVSCFPEGEWNENGAKHHGLDKLARVQLGILNGNSGVDPSCAADLQAYLQQFVVYTPLESLMPSSNVVGSIRFRRPTLHIFPGGQGDAALFGVSGFTILFDGGFGRKTCYWDFLRHVDRVDALIVSRLSNNNVTGISSFIDRLATSDCHPKLGYVTANIPTYHRVATNGETAKNPLLLSIHEEGAKIVEHLSHMGLKPQPCISTIGPTSKHLEPLTLYQKVGQGRLDMYILNPAKDSKELNDFIDSWKKGVNKVGSAKYSTKPGSNGADFTPPLTDQASIAALLVWRPADPSDQIIRVLYPGSCSQEKIVSGLEKLKHLDFLKHSICTAASLEGKAMASGSNAVPKKGLAVKAVESPRATGSVSPKAAVAPKSLPSLPKAPVAAASAAAAAAAALPSSLASATPKAAEAIAHDHRTQQSPPTVSTIAREPDLFDLTATGEPLIDVPPPPLKELTPPNLEPAEQDILSQDNIHTQAESPTLEPEHVVGVPHHETSPKRLASPSGAEIEEFMHHEQVGAAANADLLGMERGHAGYSIAAEPTQAGQYEALGFDQPIQPSVLRLSHDQLHDFHGDHSRADLVDEPSPLSPNQPAKRDLFQHQQFEAQPPSEPMLRDNPHTLPIDHTVQDIFGQQSPESPLLAADNASSSPQAPHSPRTQQRLLSALNPDAPVFVPKQSDLSPVSDHGPQVHHEHAASPMDPFSEKGFGDGVRGFSNGSNNPFEDNTWPSEAAVSPKRPDQVGLDPLSDQAAAAAAQASPEHRRKLDEAMKDWGEPLGLPAPAPPPAATSKGAQGATSTTPKPKSNGAAAGASAADKANKSTSSVTTTTTKRTTTTTRTASTGGASSKSSVTAEPKSTSAASNTTKKSAPAAPAPSTPKAVPPPAKATPAPKPSAAKPAAAPAKTAPAAVARPASGSATAPKPSAATAAPGKSAAAAKKPGPPGAVYYVDLTYIPHQGNPHYVNADFFKHVRSKYYVLSSLRPSKEILEALLSGKKSWNLPEEEVTLIPTYDSDTLSLWMALHKDELASESIDVAPSCSRCTVNLEEHQADKCAAYRLEL